ncbi:MAG: hypothetical protein MK289_09445 [Trichodesmium sp. ALOHA_ZT_67]|nr:hypothetical protein [Trichodesmium sp. ALOHA_ZT_67]MDT9339150.1 hypothetical protein [Trichodesmium erythraeum 21-75]
MEYYVKDAVSDRDRYLYNMKEVYFLDTSYLLSVGLVPKQNLIILKLC